MKQSSVLVVVIACALLSACGSQLSEEDAREVWSHVSGELGGRGGQALTAEIDLTRDCRDGGTLRLQGTLNAGDQILDATSSAQFDYEATFAACADDGDTIDGDLNYTSAMAAAAGDASASTSVVFGYAGSITVSGEHNGSCEVDMEGHMDASASAGAITTATIVLVYQGTICGHDASETLNVSATN